MCASDCIIKNQKRSPAIYLPSQADLLATVLPGIPVALPGGFGQYALAAWLLWLVLTGYCIKNRYCFYRGKAV